MPRKNTVATLIVSASLISGCSMMDISMPSMDSLWPSFLDKEPPPSPVQVVDIKPSKSEPQKRTVGSPIAPPTLNSTNFIPPSITPGETTGTFVGKKVQMLRAELRRMQTEIAGQNNSLQTIRRETQSNAKKYHASIAAINSKLQVGTTPGNPFMVQEWNKSQQLLSKIDGDIGKMNGLANSVAGSSTMSAYLLETTRAAYGVTGAVDEDHRQLAILEDEVNRTVVLIDRLLNELSEDIARQSSYVSNERMNLTTLSLGVKNGELLGNSLSNRAYNAVGGMVQNPSAPLIDRKPLVIIRFDRPNVQYKQALYTAINRALQRRSDVGFDIVAVTAGQGSNARITVESNKAKRNAEAVLRSLSEMGLPLDRVRLSSTTSPAARSNEVHVFVR
jgi:hypothetical protein